ncbi:hypothetical protein I5M27_10480 [Adhaeribacter sp. BT258]|uniref:Lipopolysaccharide assembly protein A domain-containing protein n=1 Tax=Adhaeribacter terrigena TaxID=2793070 RepID=A0ABS1C466_9BACT|nr:hypothetical protein [Adhaeribacter terrigena]MBK0403413.1 hypothetical protein [Adhaeribacter terrigena]
METLRKFVNVVVLLFLGYALLVMLNIISTPYLDETLTTFNPENYYKTIFGIAAGLLLVYLLISNMSILALKRERANLNNRINELKASLYDRKAEETRDYTSQTRPATNPISKPDPIFPPDNLQ